MSNNVFAISNDINQILPFYPELISGEVADVIPKMQAMAQAGNMYANYVLGVYFIFGRVPRHYKFYKSYAVGCVKKEALITISEQLGLSYLIQLLKIQNQQVESYHLKGIFDLYKIVEGKAVFFENNDIACRPTETEFLQLKKLFDAVDQIRNILVRFDHYEIYLDHAKHKLELFSESNDKEDFKEALDCLNKIVEKSEFNQFNVFDISEAHYLLGKIHLFGNEFHKRDAKAGVEHIQSSRLDKAYVALLDFYKGFGDKYIKSIRKCLGMINDQALRVELMKQNGFTVPVAVDITDVLKKLHFSPVIENITPVLSVESLPEYSEEDSQEEDSYEAKLREEELLKEDLSRAEDFDTTLLDDNTDLEMEINLTDDAPIDEDDSDHMNVDEFEYPDMDEIEPDFDIPDM